MATHAVTGAFGYSGRYIARLLLAQGDRVITLTNSPERRHDLGDDVEVHPLCFGDPDGLARSLEGVSVLFNTYWVRFNHADFSHAEAVRNTEALFRAAKAAGVERVVHVSITNPDEASPLEYFRGKGRLERALRESGLSYAILRPAVLFGGADILVNNMAWALRYLPVFGVFGDGQYRVQPIHVNDFALLAVQESGKTENTVVDAIGPETFRYRELVSAIAEIIGVRRPILSVPPWLGYQTARLLGRIVGDVVLTQEEIEALMTELLCVEAPPAGGTKLTEWAQRNAGTLGRTYASELGRRRDRKLAYGRD